MMLIVAVAYPAASSGQTAPDRVEELKAKAKEDGHVSVLVRFEVANLNELTNQSNSAKNQQEADQFDGFLSTAIAEVADRALKPLEGLDCRIHRVFRYTPGAALDVTAEGVDRLADSPLIADIREEVPEPPTLDGTTREMGAALAWLVGYTGAGQYVAVLDTGLRTSHEMFAGKTIVEACFSRGQDGIEGAGDCPNGSSSQVGTGAAEPHYGWEKHDHGTHVAGIAVGDNGATHVGVARDADLIAMQVFSKFSDCNCVLSWPSDQIAALEWLYNNRMNYTIASANISIGGDAYSDQNACDSEHANRKGAIDNLVSADIAVVISSGNEEYCNALSAPGCISSAIAVGAVTDDLEEPYFSNYHSEMLDVFAPGYAVLSAGTGGDGQYVDKSGTSMAAPHVAGAIALIKEADPAATVADMRTNLQETGRTVEGRCIGTPAQRSIWAPGAIWRHLGFGDPTWADFGTDNPLPLGNFPSPYDNLLDALLAVQENGFDSIVIKSSQTDETYTIDIPVRLHAWNGSAVIGAQ